MEPHLLKVRSLSHHYASKMAVADISFDLEKNEILGILGSNGAGKTTVMQMLGGVLCPSHGTVEISGHDLLAEPRKARRQIGFLPEEVPYYPELTTDEYLRFCARLRGVATPDLPDALNQSKRLCGLLDCGDRLLRNLSAGLRQRAGIAQAIIHKPKLLILDESTAALDPVQRHDIHALLRTLSEHCGILFSTHMLSEVKSLCSRVLIIHHGRIVMDQPLRQLDETGGSERMEFRFRNPPDITVLRAFPNVAAVKKVSDHTFVLDYRPNMDETDTVLRASLEQDWQLESCMPAHDTLESLFLGLTKEDA